MKKYTKFGISLLATLLVTSFAFAADTVATAKATTTTAPTSLFNSGEFGLSIGSGYTLDKAALFNADYTFNLNAGAFWFPWRNFGFEAIVPFYQTTAVSVDEVQAGMLFRLPLAETTPVLRSLAPYVGLGGVYNWDTVQDWAYIAKIGLDIRFNPKWGIFLEGAYRNFELRNWSDGQTTIAGGLKLAF